MTITAKEELLIGRWLEKDAAALPLLLEEYGRPIYGFCVLFFSGDSRFADTLFSKACASLLKSPGVGELRVPFALQLLSWVLHEIRSSFGAKPDAPEGSVPSVDALKKFWPEEEAMTRRRFHLLLKALGGMSAEERAVLLLRDQLDLDHHEMTELMGLSEKKIHRILSKARLLLGESVDRIVEGSRP